MSSGTEAQLFDPERIRWAVRILAAAAVVGSLGVVLTHIDKGFDPWGQNIAVTGVFVLLVDQLVDQAQRVRSADVAAARFSLLIPRLKQDIHGFLSLVAQVADVPNQPNESDPLWVNDVFPEDITSLVDPGTWQDNDVRLLLEAADRVVILCNDALAFFSDAIPPSYSDSLYETRDALTRGLRVTRNNFDYAQHNQTQMRKDHVVAKEVAKAGAATAELARGWEVATGLPFFSVKAYNMPNIPASVVAGIVEGNHPAPPTTVTRQRLKALNGWRRSQLEQAQRPPSPDKDVQLGSIHGSIDS